MLECQNIYKNLATEDWIYKNLDFKDKSLLLLWRNNPCVVIGRHQNPWAELDVTLAEEDDVMIARRNSGGGTVYHDLGNMCVTFFTHRDRYDRKHNLELICQAVRKKYSLDVSVNNRDDILLNQEFKISGTAAKLGAKKAYHHCTLLLNVDKNRVNSLLRSTVEGLKSNATESVRAQVKNLCEMNPQVSYRGVCEAIAEEYVKSFDCHAGIEQIRDPTEDEFPGISKCLEDLRSWEWTFGKTPKFSIARIFSGYMLNTHMNLDLKFEVHKGCLQNIEMSLMGCEFPSQTCEVFIHTLTGVRFCPNEICNAVQNIKDDDILFMQCDELGYNWIAKCLNEI